MRGHGGPCVVLGRRVVGALAAVAGRLVVVGAGYQLVVALGRDRRQVYGG